MNMKYNVMKRRDVEKMTAGTTVCIDSLGGCMQVCIRYTSIDEGHSDLRWYNMVHGRYDIVRLVRGRVRQLREWCLWCG